MPQLLCNASVFYKIIADSMYGQCNHLRQIWERDLTSNTEEEAWDEVVWDAISTFTHYKVIHRYYYTTVKLHKMGLMRDKMFWKSMNARGSNLHLLWDCPLVFPFWQQVFKTIREWLTTPLPESPQLCLIGDRSLLPPGVSEAESALALAGFNHCSKNHP